MHLRFTRNGCLRIYKDNKFYEDNKFPFTVYEDNKSAFTVYENTPLAPHWMMLTMYFITVLEWIDVTQVYTYISESFDVGCT